MNKTIRAKLEAAANNPPVQQPRKKRGRPAGSTDTKPRRNAWDRDSPMVFRGEFPRVRLSLTEADLFHGSWPYGR